MSSARRLRSLYVRSGLREALPHGVKVALRRVWLRIARHTGYPISSPLRPRPPLAPHRASMRLSRVLLACDLNPDYLEYWPSTRRAWEEIVGVDPLLVLVAHPDAVPPELARDDAVIPFAPISGLHTAFQAQCIRLLYPALVETDGAVLVSDMDLYPLDRSYFHRPIARLDSRFFVCYRDARFARGEIDIMFNAALPATWSEIFGVATLGDVRARLAAWGAGREYDGRRGWPGWYTDQQILYTTLTNWPAARERVWMLDDDYCGFYRLDRLELEKEQGLEPHRRAALLAGKYTDYNCLFPYHEHRQVNDLVLELALEAARSQPRSRTRFLV